MVDPHHHMTRCRKCAAWNGNAVIEQHEAECKGPPHTCTKENPWDARLGLRAVHPDAKIVYSDDSHSLDSADRYECPNCHHKFWVEIAN